MGDQIKPESVIGMGQNTQSIAEDPEDNLQIYALSLLDRLYNQTAQGTVH